MRGVNWRGVEGVQRASNVYKMTLWASVDAGVDKSVLSATTQKLATTSPRTIPNRCIESVEDVIVFQVSQ